MYIYVFQISPLKEAKGIQSFQSYLPEKHIKLFISEEHPPKIKNDHYIIYQGCKIDMQYYKNPLLIKNFEKIREFFEPFKNCPLVYYCKSFNDLPKIFEDFIDILKKLGEKEKEKIERDQEKNIYLPIKKLFSKLRSRSETLDLFDQIDSHYNPCQNLFEEFINTKEYHILSIVHERDQTFNRLITKMTYKMNPDWKKDLSLLEKKINEEENKKLNLFDNVIDSSLIEEDNVFSEFKDDFSPEEEKTTYIILILEELFTNKKRIECDQEKIKILEKGHFSEFNILSEYIIPKKPEIINKLEKQLQDKIDINSIENILIGFNQYLDQKQDQIYVSNYNQLTNIKRKRLLKDYLSKYTFFKENTKISISKLFSDFIRFLTLYYPGCNNYFHNRNFTPLLNELGFKTQRKSDGIYCINLQIIE